MGKGVIKKTSGHLDCLIADIALQYLQLNINLPRGANETEKSVLF